MTETRSLAIGLVALAGWAALALLQYWGEWASDLGALYMAGHMIHTGRPDLVYVVSETFVNSTPPPWQPDLAAMGRGAETVYPYIYPPLWGALVAPLTAAMGPQAFFNLVAAIQIPVMALAAVIAWRLVNRAVPIPFWQWGLLSAVLLQTGVIPNFALFLMQPQITVAFFCLLAVERLTAGREGSAGVALALAAAVKLSPAILAVIFVLERRWRALGAFAGAGAALALASVLLAGWPLNLAFLDTLVGLESYLLLSFVNFSMESVLYGLWHALGLVPPLELPITNRLVPASLVPPAIPLISKGLLVLVLALALWAGRRLNRVWQPIFALFILTLYLGLFGLFNWAHYFLIQVWLAPALLALAGPGRAIAAATAAVVLSSQAVLTELAGLEAAAIICAAYATTLLLALGVGVSIAAARASRGG